MRFPRRQLVLAGAVSILGLALSIQFALANKNKQGSAAIKMDEQKRALHALNRLAFGPRPGDVERVTAIGVDKWIDQQLHPEKIDDRAIDARSLSHTSHGHTRDRRELPTATSHQGDCRRQAAASIRFCQTRGIQSSARALRGEAAT